jgi:hypothetical protein
MGTVVSRVLADVLSLRAYEKARSPVSEEPLGADDFCKTDMHRRVCRLLATLWHVNRSPSPSLTDAVQSIHHLNDCDNARWLAKHCVAWSTTCG